MIHLFSFLSHVLPYFTILSLSLPTAICLSSLLFFILSPFLPTAFSLPYSFLSLPLILCSHPQFPLFSSLLCFFFHCIFIVSTSSHLFSFSSLSFSVFILPVPTLTFLFLPPTFLSFPLFSHSQPFSSLSIFFFLLLIHPLSPPIFSLLLLSRPLSLLSIFFLFLSFFLCFYSFSIPTHSFISSSFLFYLSSHLQLFTLHFH